MGRPVVIEDGAVYCATHSFLARSGTFSPLEVQPNLEVAFEIVFHEPGVVEGEAVLHFLHRLTDLVGTVIPLFIPHL